MSVDGASVRRRGSPLKPASLTRACAAEAAGTFLVAPSTQAGLDPARDFGPRLFGFLAGWGEIAVPGPRGGFLTVYVLSPLAGGIAGAAAHRLLFAHPPVPAAEPVAADPQLKEDPWPASATS